MDAYDRKALIDVIDWHKARKDAKTTAPTAEGGGYFGWIWSCVPQSVVDYSTSAVSRALLSVETYAMDAAALAAIDEYMRTFAVSKGIQGGDISRLTLQHRDEIAASYCSPAAIAAFLQGAGLGLGGVFFVAADIPMLIAINCLMLAKVSRVYGVSASADCNANVVLRLLAAGIGSIALPVFEEEGDKLRVELQGELRVRLDRIQARINQLIVGSKDACVGTDDGTVDGSTGASSSPPDADAASLPSSQDESAGSTAGEGGDGECADTVDDQADVRGKDAPATESSPLQAPGNTPAGSELNDGPTTASRIGSAVVDAVQTVGRTVVEELRQDVMVELVKQLSTFLGLHFARSKMMQVVPLVGVAVGAGSNYWFTVRCTEAAVMTLRHHYLRSEHPEAVLAAHEEGSGWDWQVVDGADVGEDDCVHGNVALSAGVADASTQFFAAGQQVPDVEKKLDLPVG